MIIDLFLAIYRFSPRYTALVEQNIIQAAMDMEKVMEVPMNEIAEDKLLPLPSSPSNFCVTMAVIYSLALSHGFFLILFFTAATYTSLAYIFNISQRTKM